MITGKLREVSAEAEWPHESNRRLDQPWRFARRRGLLNSALIPAKSPHQGDGAHGHALDPGNKGAVLKHLTFEVSVCMLPRLWQGCDLSWLSLALAAPILSAASPGPCCQDKTPASPPFPRSWISSHCLIPPKSQNLVDQFVTFVKCLSTAPINLPSVKISQRGGGGWGSAVPSGLMIGNEIPGVETPGYFRGVPPGLCIWAGRGRKRG